MKKVIHSPFLYHLFICCGENYRELGVDIDNRIDEKIEESYENVGDNIMSREIKERGRHFTTSGFRKFVNRMEQRKNGKVPPYCKFEFYSEIRKLELDLKQKDDHCSVLQTDRNTIDEFYKLYEHFCGKEAEAINSKRLRALFKAIKDGKELNSYQEDIFIFLLTESFPVYGDVQGYLIDRIKSKQWEEVAFGDLDHGNALKNIFPKEYEKVKNLFTGLGKLSISDSSDNSDIKIIFEKISKLLDEIYKREMDFNNRGIQEKIEESQRADDLVMQQGQTAWLHSHIIAFIRWMPMVSQAELDQKVMESVDNVINKIGDQICKTIENNDVLGKNSKSYLKNNHDSIFLQEKAVQLREILIKALLQESLFIFKFKNIYEVPDDKMKGGIQ